MKIKTKASNFRRQRGSDNADALPSLPLCACIGYIFRCIGKAKDVRFITHTKSWDVHVSKWGVRVAITFINGQTWYFSLIGVPA